MQRRQFIRNVSCLAAGAMGRAALRAGESFPAAPAASLPEAFNRVQFFNVQEITPATDNEGWRLCRVPAPVWVKLNDSARKRAYSPAGCEIRFNLVGDEARILLKFVETRGEPARWLSVLAEVCHGDFSAGWAEVRDTWTELVIRRPAAQAELTAVAGSRPHCFDPDLVRVLLPLHPEVRIKLITGQVVPPRPGQTPSRRYLAYGSSITNGFAAAKPADAYPARISRLLRVDSLNLGLGGGAHLEPAIAEFIAGRDDWDFASLEMGINLLGGTHTVDEFRSRVAGFLPHIAQRRRDKWIFCIDLFTCIDDVRANPVITEYRTIVREAVKALDSPRLVYLDGRRLLTDLAGLSTDLLHPTSEGFAEIATRLGAEMKRAMGNAG